MLKLIKLELRRNNLKPYVCGSFGVFIFTLLIGILFSAIPQLEPNNESAKIIADINMLVPMITIISMSGFAILSAVMHTKFTVDEYTGKKNVLLFTYPQKRSHILIAKFVLTFTFTSISMLISNVICILLIGFIGNLLGYMVPLNLDNIFNVFLLSILFSIIANLISIISLRVGFWKKSIIGTIITSVVLVVPFGNSVVLLGDNLLIVIFPVALILIIICTILFLGLLKKVNRMECL